MQKSMALGAVLLSLSAGCGSDDSEGGGSGGGTQWDPSALTRCGLPSYDWLPADQVGTVLEKQLAQNVAQSQLTLVLSLAASTMKIAHPVNHSVSVYVMRYQTQDRGELVDATAMVAIPDVTEPTTLPMLEYLHGTSGFDDACAPSHGAADLTRGDTLGTAAFAGIGYVAVTPDYIGLKSLGGASQRPHPYLVGEATAIASLDAIRAAKQLVAEVAPSITLKGLVVAGFSQGGHAAEATTRFAPYYAPELTVAGAATIAAPTDQVGAFAGAKPNPSFWSLGVAWGYLIDGYYGGGALGKALKAPWDLQAKDVALGRCEPGYQDPLANVTGIEELMQPDLLAAFDAGGVGLVEPWSCYVRENDPLTMPVPIDKTPTLYVLGENDPLVVAAPQRAAFDTLCERGAKLSYLECAGADHSQAFYWSVDDIFEFFSARLEGKPMSGTCQRGTATTCKSTP